MACGSAEPSPFQPVASVRQVMTAILEPAADNYWDAVGTIVDESGATEFAPETQEDWDVVRQHAFVIAESGNLLMMGPQAQNDRDWLRMSQALVEAGAKAVQAAEAEDPAAVFDAGAGLYDACANCHAIYASALTRPSEQSPDRKKP